MKTGGKVIIGLVILGIITATVALNLKRREAGEEAEIQTAQRKPLLSKVTATGELKALTQVSVQPQLIGKVTRLYVKEGDIVRKDQTVCELDRTSYETATEMARIAVAQLQRTMARTDSLYRRN